MSTIAYTIVSSVSLTSSYIAYAYYDHHTSLSTPSTATANYGFSYAGMGVEPGSTVTKVRFKVGSFGSPLHGASERMARINGTDINGANLTAGTEYDITALCNGGDNTLQLRFQSGTSSTSYPSDPSSPGTPNQRTNSGALSFNDVQIIVDYILPYTAASMSYALIQNSSGTQFAPASSNVSLSWVGANGNYNPITDYTIQRRTNGGAWEDFATVSASPLTVAAHASGGSRYEYQVRANAANGSSGFVISPALYTYSAPSTPTGLALNPTVVFLGQTAILSWNASQNGTGVGISQYEVQRNGAYLTAVGGSPLTITAPSTAGSYTYRIKAVGNVAGYDSGYTATVTLVVQNPASTFSLNRSSVPADDISSITATISPADPAYSHVVRWYINGSYTKTNTLGVGATSNTYVIPLNWCAAFPSATSGIAYCTVTTMNGATPLGEATQSFTITIPASVVPTASISCNPSGSPAGFTTYYLVGISRCACVATASGMQGSSITNITFNTTGESSSGVATSWTSGILTTVGTHLFSVTVTDSRGRSTTSTVVNITVTSYSLPNLVVNNCYRSNSGGVADGNGTYYTIKATGSVSTVGSNVLSILRVRSLQIGGTWSAYTNLTNAAVTTIGADAISIEYAYTIEVTVNDSIGTALGRANGVITATILPAVRGADIRNDRAAFGRIAATANRLMLPPDWDIEHKGQTLDQRFSAIAHTHSLAQVSGITPAAIGAINKAGDTLTGVLFHTKGIITTGIASNFRGQAFGNAAANYHTVRPVRCDTGSITGFPIYGSGLAWSTDDTHSYIDVPYVAGDIYVGGGNGNTLNWQTKLWSAQNFDPATKVNKSGDTMAGTLTSNAQYGMVINSSTAESSIQYNQSAVMKWVVGKGVGGIGEYFGWYYANGVNTNRMALTTDGALQIISGGGNYSEGIRISSAPNGYSDIQFGASPTVGYGAQAGQWFLGKKANGYFCIAQAGNQDLSNCGLLISPNNTDVFINNYRTYHAGNFTRGTWTPSGGSDGDMFVQYV